MGRGYCLRHITLFCILTLVLSCAKKEIDERFSTPIKTYNHWLETSLKGDIVKNMECMTKASRKFMDSQAKMRDIFIQRMTASAEVFSKYKVSNEKIKDNRALVVIRDSDSGNAIAVPFLYEEDGWKVDLIAMFSGQVAAEENS